MLVRQSELLMKDEELLRYSRQILLPEVDVDGQEKFLASKVLVVGAGGLGSPVSMYLTAAGVGNITIADFDVVDLSNLQRQIVHNNNSIGLPKVESAKSTLRNLNPSTNITTISDKLRKDELLDAVGVADVVVDCTDNFSTRFAINRACVEMKTPLVSGAAIRLEGQISVFDLRQDDSPCYRCLYEEVDDENLSCSENGVLAPLVGIIGSMQACETLKLIAGFGETLVGRLQILDVKTMNWRQLRLKKDPNCPICK